jgi:hypothetical protein
MLSVWSALCVLKKKKKKKEEGWATVNSGQCRKNNVGTKKRGKKKERGEKMGVCALDSMCVRK